MVTGKPAFLRASVAETMAAILNENPERIAVSINLDRIIFQCLAKDVGDRFTTASAVASALSLPAEEVQARKSSEKIESLAVLPFLNAASASEIDYLCDGITESLINNLSQIPKLRVVPRSTVFRYKDMGMDPQRFVLGLGVRTVLTGKILQRGDILVVQAELVDIATDSQLWGQKYSRKVTDIFAVEEEISREIAAALQIKLNNTEKKQLSRRSTEDGEAYQLYLKGRYLWNQRKRTSLERAVGYFQQAIERDPDYALAYAGLADCFIVMGSFQFWPPQEAFPRAQATAQRAIEIDEGLAEARIVLAIVNAVFERNGKAALREFERAIRLDANYAVAHQWFGSHLCFVGDFEAGLRELRLAQQLEPLSPMINVQLGVGLYLARHYDKSAQVLRNMIAFEPDFWPAHFFLGLVSTEQLDNSRALEEMNRSSELSGRHPLTLSGLGYAFCRAGERHNSVRILEELHVLARTEYVAPDHFALIHLALDDETLALEQLHEVVQQRSPYGAWLAVDPRLDALRTDVRFQDILRSFSSRSEE
jgi:TolB-like protein/Flp pilus assembly protein TadD